MRMVRNFWLLNTVDGRLHFLFYIILFVIASSAHAQNIVRAEYFFDNDPGIGSGTALPLTPTGGDITFTSSISTASLSPGFHQLAIRVKESGGGWSNFEARGFYITAATSDVTDIAAAEYFIDGDPGNGNGTSIPVTTGATVNFVVNVPTTSLSNGFHFLTIRTRDLSGRWGVFEYRGFYISTATTNASDIVAAEYFFDADPGNGSGTSIPVVAGAVVNFTVSLPSTGLPSGFHFLSIRTKGSDGRWGIFESRGFYVSSSTADVPNILAAEYFFDSDPGVGNGLSIPITAGPTPNFTASIPVNSLSPGFHFLTIRTQGLNGQWGEFESRGFYISPLVANAGDIVAAEYFIDTDPGEDNAAAVVVNPTGPTINQIFSIDVTGVTSGTHTLGFRVKDANGMWSEVERASFDILSCTPPPSPVASGVSRCGAGTVTLTASGASGSQVYRWYDDAVSTTPVATGGSFLTPSLSATKKYYVSLYDPATTCESARIEVTATVTIFAKPGLNVSGSIQFCEGNSILLSAPAGFTHYVWSNGATSQTINADTTGNYSVSISNDGTCFSPGSDPVNVTVLTGPAKPTIQVTGSTVLCGPGATTLSGPAGFQYLWSTGATTRDISVTQAGVYSLTIRSGGGCSSVTSDPVVITTGGAQATITQSDNFLIASAGDSYKWFLNGTEIPGAHSQVLEIGVTEFGVYSVEVNDGGCISQSEDFEYLVTGVPDEFSSSVQVFPNPVQGNLTVNLPDKAEMLRITDVLGKTLLQQEGEKGENVLNTYALTSGIYYLTIKSHDHVMVFKVQKL